MIASAAPEELVERELRAAALHCLCVTDAREKASRVAEMAQAYRSGVLLADANASLMPSTAIPGRPARPQLVPPLEVRQRSMRTAEGRAALIHALAHIEFNAINLALDAIWRFSALPVAYYEDWLKVAEEEAFHYSLLAAHLETLGFAYGDFPAHNSLWDMAEKTGGDVLARLALVPRTLEARGLDASPAVRAKLAQSGDLKAAEILDIILRDEIGHVAIGNQWFSWLCAQRKLDPLQAYAELAVQYKAPPLRGPFNLEARRAAGFTEAELAALGR